MKSDNETLTAPYWAIAAVSVLGLAAAAHSVATAQPPGGCGWPCSSHLDCQIIPTECNHCTTAQPYGSDKLCDTFE